MRRETGNALKVVLLGLEAGWAVAAPILGGVLVGVALDRSRGGGSLWTLVFLGVGLLLGIGSGAQLIFRTRRVLRS